MTELRQRMIADLRIRNYSPRTIDCYTRCVAAFARHFGQSPADLGAQQIRAYQTHLVDTKHGSWTGFNQAVCALRFLYGTTLQRPGLIEDIPFPRQPKTLPVVLSRAELARFFAAISNRKHRTVLMTMYAAGLRLSEALHLSIADVDSSRQCLRVAQGKGQKDRYTLLPPTLLQQLRAYCAGEYPLSITDLEPTALQAGTPPYHPTAQRFSSTVLAPSECRTRPRSRSAPSDAEARGSE